MEQNNKNNMESFDSNAETAVFSPIEEKKEPENPVERPVREIYYDDDVEPVYKKSESSASEGNNGILIGLVIVLIVLFIATIIWGTVVLTQLNKNEDSAPQEPKETVVETPEETPEIVEEEPESQKTECLIIFNKDSVKEEGDKFSVYSTMVLGGNERIHKKVYIDKDSVIEEDGNKLLYKSFVNYTIENLGESEVLFDAVIDEETYHVDRIYYSSEILKKEEVILPEEPTEPEITEEPTIVVE